MSKTIHPSPGGGGNSEKYTPRKEYLRSTGIRKYQNFAIFNKKFLEISVNESNIYSSENKFF